MPNYTKCKRDTGITSLFSSRRTIRASNSSLKKLAEYRNAQIDLKNAGRIVLEEPAVTDGSLITSRHPIDVADFSIAVAEWLKKH